MHTATPHTGAAASKRGHKAHGALLVPIKARISEQAADHFLPQPYGLQAKHLDLPDPNQVASWLSDTHPPRPRMW